MQMKNALANPRGDKINRREDDCGIIDRYIGRVENGKYEVKRYISKEDLAAIMPLPADRRSEHPVDARLNSSTPSV
jgi:branched-chain amino acid transport system substrate-binding protein